jgi:hypothetical protein
MTRNLRVVSLFFGEDSLVDFSLLELLELLLVLAKIKLFLVVLDSLNVVVAVEHRALEQQTQTRNLGNADLLIALSLDDAFDGSTTADSQCDHTDHLADLVHHERLTVDL